ncbi:MAG: FMN-binding protein [Spirochaetaceae bacterium]|nr:FMN-binding protein [Spirochaetaceae bacterium]
MRPYAALAVLSLVFAACPNDSPEEKDNRHAPYGSPPYSGQVTGEANGSHGGGQTTIKLTLTLEEGYITGVDFGGSTGITPSIGSQVRDQAPAQIIAANSFNDDAIDTVTRATITRITTIAAGKNALNTIPGVNVE